jgi:hypothetical protein
MTSAPPIVWRRWWGEVRALALPLVSYWFALFVGLGLFTAAVAVFETMDQEGTLILLGLWLATTVGVSAGQLLALLRLRTVHVVLAMSGSWLFAWLLVLGQIAALGVPSGTGEDIMLVFLILLMVGPFFAVCGVWSLTTHLDIVATWAPLAWLTAAIVVISEKTGAVERWHAGDKWAIWSVLTAPLLGVGVLVVLLYLAARELHRLHHWRTSPRGPDVASEPVRPGFRAPRALPGCGTLGVLVLLGLFLTGASALIAPFLWRTGPGDRDGGDGGSNVAQEQPDDAGHRAQQESERERDASSDGDGISARQLAEQAQQAAKQAAFSLLMLLLLLLLAVLGLLVFGPPLRRMLYLQHLRRPFWPVAPTRRIQQHWRLVEVALGDLGVYRQPGDTAESLARRACAQRRLVDPDALVRCASTADRVVFGLGILPEDADLTRRTAEMTYQAAWDELNESQKFRAMYRFL